MSEPGNQIRSNIELVNEKIAEALQKAHRKPRSVKLVVVTKGQTVEKMQTVIDAGCQFIGENYPEETQEKIGLLTGIDLVEWHMIGHVQSRKIKYLVKNFDLVESVESLETAQKISSRFEEAGRSIKMLLEVNISGESSKQGFSTVERQTWSEFVDRVNEIQRMPAVELMGLMTMPPLGADAEDSRAYFKRMLELMDYVNLHKKGEALTELSMGTSFDYTVAVEEGATIVRVGEAIMGARDYS